MHVIRWFLSSFSLVAVTLDCVTCTTRPIIGIVSQELTPKMRLDYPTYSSYFTSQYVKAVESSGARVVPVTINQSDSYYRKLLNSINGIVLPGGATLPGHEHPYYDTVSKLYRIAKEINDNGQVFPILAVCLGFEFILTVANNEQSFLTRCHVFLENLPLKFLGSSDNSSLYAELTAEQKLILENRNVTVNLHRWCALPENFEMSHLKYDWKITATSTSSDNTEFVSTVEHTKYPFFGLQFHPEKALFEWDQSKSGRSYYPHSHTAIVANRYFYDRLITYARLNDHKFDSVAEENKFLIYNFPVTYNPNYNISRQFYLF